MRVTEKDMEPESRDSNGHVQSNTWQNLERSKLKTAVSIFRVASLPNSSKDTD